MSASFDNNKIFLKTCFYHAIFMGLSFPFFSCFPFCKDIVSKGTEGSCQDSKVTSQSNYPKFPGV